MSIAVLTAGRSLGPVIRDGSRMVPAAHRVDWRAVLVVHLLLCDRATRTEAKVSETVVQLAEHSGLSPAVVKRSLSALEHLGLWRTVERGRRTPEGEANRGAVRVALFTDPGWEPRSTETTDPRGDPRSTETTDPRREPGSDPNHGSDSRDHGSDSRDHGSPQGATPRESSASIIRGSSSSAPPAVVAEHFERHRAWKLSPSYRGGPIRSWPAYRLRALAQMTHAHEAGEDLEQRWPTGPVAAPAPDPATESAAALAYLADVFGDRP